VADASVPLVSVLIPCRDERAHIGACLDSLLADGWPADRLEVLVIDGMSTDGTRAEIAARAETDSRVRLIDNPRGVTPTALNLGLAAARGEVIMLAGAHTVYPAGYIPELVTALRESGADGVGGVCRTCPGEPTALARAIATALAHPLGVGNSYFRIGTSRSRWADTVPFGCYRRDAFERVGGFDEELVRNQDDEFNMRLCRRGGRLLLVPHVVSEYRARADVGRLWRMFYQYGFFKPLVLRKVGGAPAARQLAPLALVLGLTLSALAAPWSGVARVVGLALGGSYAVVLLASALLPRRDVTPRSAILLPLVLPVMHFAYGIGFVRGAARILWSRGGWRPTTRPVPSSR
jgi:glycosyltransferase involved in cell wall biosynthesis